MKQKTARPEPRVVLAPLLGGQVDRALEQLLGPGKVLLFDINAGLGLFELVLGDPELAEPAQGCTQVRRVVLGLGSPHLESALKQ
jgi:hypothetical protein